MNDLFTDADDPPECFLRILSGAHLGTCVPLPQGDYEIGSGRDSDFIIADDSIKEKHATLAVTQGNVKLLRLANDASIYLDGEPAAGESFPLAPEQVFTLGGTHFTLTEKGGREMPRIPIPVIEPPADEEEEDGGVEENSGNGDEEDLPAETAEPSDFAAQPRSPLTSAGCIVGYLICLLLAIGAAFYFSGRGSAGSEAPPVVPPEIAVADVLKNYPEETGIQIEKDETTGLVTVNGLVTSSEAKTAITREVRMAIPRARVKISSMPSVESAVRSTLDQLGGEKVTADLGLDGNLILNGPVADESTGPKLGARLAVTIPALNDINVEGVWTRENLIEKLNAATTQFKLQDFLSFALEESDLVVGGTLPPSEVSPFEKLKAKLKAEFEPGLRLVDRVRILEDMPVSTRAVVAESGDSATPPPAPKPEMGPSEVPLNEKAGISGFRNVTVGPISWVVTGDGEKLLEGATLPSGFTVEKITRDYVQLRKQNIVETIYLK